MIQRPPDVGAFQFAILAGLRAAQLIRGCRPLVEGGHKATVTAQIEVSEGKIAQYDPPDSAPLLVPIILAPIDEALALVPAH